MPGRNMVGDYRYGFQGQYSEKDDETGLNAFELRMYDSRIGRWLSPDPAGQYNSPYLGMGNNPISLIDPDGGMTDCEGCPIKTVQLNEVLVTGVDKSGGRGIWSSEVGLSGTNMWASNHFIGSLGAYNKRVGQNFTNHGDEAIWHDNLVSSQIAEQHRREFYAGREAYGKGVVQLMSALTLPVSIVELGTAAVIYSGSRAAFSFSDDIALLSDDIINYSIKTQSRAPKGGLIKVNANSSLSSFGGGQFTGSQTILNFGKQIPPNFSTLSSLSNTLRPAVHATLATPALNGASGVGLSSLILFRQVHQK